MANEKTQAVVPFMANLSLSFGALVPKLKEQLKEQKITVTESEIAHFQKDADGIVRLKIRGLLTDSVSRDTSRKLLKNIVKFLEGR